jgi:RNA polymerase sigma-70 factor (ECF subfamily)
VVVAAGVAGTLAVGDDVPSRAMTRTAGAWERELVARIVAGDDSAVTAAFDQFSPAVFGVAARMVGRHHAHDVCQEVFVALWDHPERFDPDRASLRTYLVMITRRRCIDHLRRSGRRDTTEQSASRRRDVAPVRDVDEAALAMIAGERVRAALDCLPVEQRRAIELAYFDGLSFRDVAVATGVSEGTAKSRLRLALQRLGAALGPHERLELS